MEEKNRKKSHRTSGYIRCQPVIAHSNTHFHTRPTVTTTTTTTVSA